MAPSICASLLCRLVDELLNFRFLYEGTLLKVLILSVPAPEPGTEAFRVASVGVVGAKREGRSK